MKSPINLKCNHCGGMKYIGEEYYAFGTLYVDIPCLICGRSVDIEVEVLKKYLSILEKAVKNANKQNNSK